MLINNNPLISAFNRFCHPASLYKIIIAVFCIALFGCSSSGSNPISQAQQLYSSAKEYDNQWMFTTAKSLYNQADAAFISEGNTSMAQQCRNDIQRIVLFNETYPYNESQLRQLISAQIPSASAARIDGWFAGRALEHVTIDGSTKYLTDQIISNIKFRNLDLFRADASMVYGYQKAVSIIMDNFVNNPKNGC